MLSQQIDGHERVIAYGSKSLDKSQKNYCTTRLELLAIVHFTKMFRPYLLGQSFTIRTDHAALQWLRNLRDPTGQLARWLLALQEFDFVALHRPWAQHRNADSLSRAPHPDADTCPACTSRITAVMRSPTPVGQEQLDDDDIQAIRGAVEANRSLDWEELNHLSAWGIRLWKWRKNLVVRDNWVYLKRGALYKLIVPSHAVRDLLTELHAGIGGGHYGISKLKEQVRKRFWWPDMYDDIRSFVQECSVCERVKDPTPRGAAELQSVETSRPFQFVGVDIMGPLTITARGNKYILVLIDHFSKWVEAVALPSQQAEVVTAAIFEHWISRHGVPERLHSDQGSNLESSVFREFCSSFGIRHSHKPRIIRKGTE